ncbi:PREDICTED: uncharacterized protein LOC106747550 [Dinoponera quadriceps]|uniref:Uncharacterized protein LOC106747550 n=1 Tax=Dinoponera quadriceps TaxID=609295 RepID=A0A6P3XRY2_DINQU|nr:PREDICTED: uncharacterized protein LOC106747550 [Dinoponera quadriceps]
MKGKKMNVKKNLQQPSSSYADYATELTDDEDVGKDFGSLIDAPLSKGGYFVFKSEKDWSPVDFSSEYSEFFTLNLNTLSHALDSIPFNEYVDVEDRYFTSDQLTSICNKADESKAAYNCILNIAKTSSSSNTVLTENEMNEDTSTERLESLENTRSLLKDQNNLEDDIDFLLSLDEPVEKNLLKITQTFSIPSASMCSNNDSKPKSKNIPAKPLDLEKWLDSVLDD